MEVHKVSVTWNPWYGQAVRPDSRRTLRCFGILAAISLYKLRLRYSLTRHTHMDEGYNTMILDLYFEMTEKLSFSTPQMAKVHVAPPYYVIFAPLDFIYS
jgi:hypothetical protein